MADYKRMYAILCSAVDSAIGSLDKIPAAMNVKQTLQSALLEAEEMYIDTEPYLEETENQKILKMRHDMQLH